MMQRIEAHITEINDGPFFRVNLLAVPCVGELIDLHSYLDQKAGFNSRKLYEVVSVIHKVHEPKEDFEPLEHGSHFVTVLVKTSNSKYFDSAPS